MKIYFFLFILAGLCICTGCQTGRSASSRLSIVDPAGKSVGFELPKNMDTTKLDAGVVIMPDGTRYYWVKADKLKTDASGPIFAAGEANAKAIQQGASIGAAVAKALAATP